MIRHRVATVSFLNSRPLIWGLDRDESIQLLPAVPSKLADHLREERADVALLPTIDYQRLPGLQLMPRAGGIGSAGETLTVRLFSRTPIQSMTRLACDPDSHTSVALARIILAKRFDRHPEMVSLSDAGDDPLEARLLIGDKVVCAAPKGFEHQHDLGDEWRKLTGLPFVFAMWTGRDGVDLGAIEQRLVRARTEGLRHVTEIVREHAVPLGWPADLAHRYLTSHLQYEIGPDHLRAVSEFHRLAAEMGILGRVQPLRMV